MSIATFGSAENNYNKQLAAAYITYMMAGSRFKKCVFHNPMEEEHLRLHYRAMKQSAQQDLEERINDAVEEVLPEGAGFEEIDEENTEAEEGRLEEVTENPNEELYCEVRTSHQKGSYVMRFLTGGFGVDCEAVISGDGRLSFHRIAATNTDI